MLNSKMNSFFCGLLLIGTLFTIQADKITGQKTVQVSGQAVAELKWDRFNQRFDVVDRDFKTRGHIKHDRWLDRWECSSEDD